MKKLFLFFVLFVLAGASTLWAQTKVITGTVTSATEGEGTIPSVSVFVKGTTVATSTDANGRYSLNVPENATTLVFSFIGMKQQEVEIAGRSVVDCVMESDVVGLNEVIVTALGIKREKKGSNLPDTKSWQRRTCCCSTHKSHQCTGRQGGRSADQRSG